jgi:transposase
MEKYIRATQDRDQQTLFRETLEESLPDDHPVRSVDSIVDLFDFSEWECEYSGGGRPSYTPWDMSKLLLYGNMVGLRSSRKLEYACLNNRDFIWLMRGLTPDHDTIADFRKRNGKRFRQIFRESVRVGIEAGIISMRQIAIDGTRVQSNSSRWGTKSKKEIERILEGLDLKIDEMMSQAEEEDRAEDRIFGRGQSPNHLPKELADLQKRKELLTKAYEKVVEKTERAKRRSLASENKRVPLTDPDSDVMMSKGGGFAPNYNAYVAVDCESGMIVAKGVDSDHMDESHMRRMCEESMEVTGMKVDQVLADSGYSSTQNLEYLEDKGIDACMPPLNTSLERKKKVEKRAWPDGVPEVASGKDGIVIDTTSLPLNKEGRFDKSAFRYDEEHDCYVCPMGHEMTRCGRTRSRTRHPKMKYRYRCNECMQCPFKSVCAPGKFNRTINRNSDAKIHERHKIKMEDPRRIKDYKLRRQTVEPAFGIIKEVQKLRMFLTRGSESVETEWTIASTAFNIRKLLRSYDRILAFAAAK